MRNGVAVVTGGSSGIGLATCKALMAKEFRCYFLGRDERKGAASQQYLSGLNLPGSAEFIPCDVSRNDSIKGAISLLGKKESHVSLLINGAGMLYRESVEDAVPEHVYEQIATMLSGTILMTAGLTPLLAAAGSSMIINISSVAGRESFPGLSAYGAAKAGLLHFTRTAAKELFSKGIRVNCICPGLVETSLQSAAQLAMIVRTTPGGRLQKPEEIADFIVAISQFDILTGAIIDVDDGVGLFSDSASSAQPSKPEKASHVSGHQEPSDNVSKDLATVFQRVFGISNHEIHSDFGPDDTTKWDSLGHIRLVGELEKTFDRRFNVEEVMKMTSFGAILHLLQGN